MVRLLVCVRLLATATVAAGWRWQSGYAPLRLVACHNASLTQQFRQEYNGTIMSPTKSKMGPAYCLAVLPAGNGSQLSGAAVVAADCGDPRYGRQLWREPRGGVLVRQPGDASLCFAVGLRPGSANSTEGSQGSLLHNCSSAEAKFDFGFVGTSATTGSIVHRASGLCVTVGSCASAPPPPPKQRLKFNKGAAPCDIFAADGAPCVAAHSTTRALYAKYDGALYSVKRSSDNATKSIPVLAPGGYANVSMQDVFCADVDCVITKLFDQSPRGNDLVVFHYDTRRDRAANASADRHTVGGHAVYSLFIEPGMGYRTKPGAANGVAVGAEAQSIYMVTAGNNYNDKCCFDCECPAPAGRGFSFAALRHQADACAVQV